MARDGWGIVLLAWASLFGATAPGCERTPSDDGSEERAESVQSSDEQEERAKKKRAEQEGSAAGSDEPETAGSASNAASKLPTVKASTVDGGEASLEPNGETTLINLWATWCAPCLAEMPEISKVHAEWKSEGLRTVALSIESKKAQKKVAKWVEENDPSFRVLLAPETSPLKSFGAGSVPASFLYDGDGELVWSRGGKLTEADFESLRDELESRLGG